MPKEKKSYIITYVRAFKVQKENWLLPIKKKKIGWGGAGNQDSSGHHCIVFKFK